MSFLDPLPFVWWRRAISSNAPNVRYNDGLPFHMVFWSADRIIRVKNQENRDGPLASVTDVEVDLKKLTALVQPIAADHPSTLALRAKRETGSPLTWLHLEVARRKECGEPHGRDSLVIALREKHPGMSKRVAVGTIEKLPLELRAKRGRRSVKSGPK